MNCDKFNDILLTDFIDGLVDPETAVQIQEHLDSCLDCSTKYDQLLNLKGTINDIFPMVKTPDAVWNNIKSNINTQRRENFVNKLHEQLKNIFFPENFNYRPVLAYSFIVMLIATATLRLNITSQSSNQELKLVLNEEIKSLAMDKYDLFIEGNNDFATDIEICFL